MFFAIKIDVDTERGTRIGVTNLKNLLLKLNIPATFLFALGPDNTGRAIKRVFRRGFLQKVSRTSVVSTYGIRTLLNGVLVPGPHIGRRHATLMREVAAAGFETGIHAYDHERWQDGVNKMSAEEIAFEFNRARQEFTRIFGREARSAGAPGWQANEKTLAVYDAANLLYGSDCRGQYPFFPKIGEHVFNTLQIPTTLPTLDELIGRPDFPEEKLLEHYFSLLKADKPNVMTVHAELEGMKYLAWFSDFLHALKQQNVNFTSLQKIAEEYLQQKAQIPVCALEQAIVPGRSGEVSTQGVKS